MKRFRLLAALAATFLLGLVFLAIAQSPSNQSATTVANAPFVEIENPANGATFSPHSDIPIDVFVAMMGADRGDTLRLECFANTNRIGKQTVKWHPTIRPPQIGNQATPMWIRPSGFDPVEFVWKNPPPGTYTLTIKATWKKIFISSVSIKITVTP